MNEVDINQTHGLETGTEDGAYYIPNPEYDELLVKKNRLLKKYDDLKIKQEKIEERYFTLKRQALWEKYLSNKTYQKVLDEQNQALYEIATIDDNLLNVPDYIPYTKKDGSLYTYIDFSKINLMNALKGAVFNMRSRMKDIAKEYFKDYRELSKFLETLANRWALRRGGAP